MRSETEHFPWHYTEFGVVCACGASMRDEVCPVETRMTAANDPTTGQRHMRGDVDEDDGTCPDCLPGSMCLACGDDDRFHRGLDMRLEER